MITVDLFPWTGEAQKTQTSVVRLLLKDPLLNAFVVSPVFWSFRGHLEIPSKVRFSLQDVSASVNLNGS